MYLHGGAATSRCVASSSYSASSFSALPPFPPLTDICSKFLNRLPELTAPNGLVVFISPYSWLPQYTKKSNWIGARYVAPEAGAGAAAGAGAGAASGPVALRSREELIVIMRGLGFRLVHEEDCPWVIREHARKFNWGCSHVTAFQRVGEGSAPEVAAAEVV